MFAYANRLWAVFTASPTPDPYFPLPLGADIEVEPAAARGLMPLLDLVHDVKRMVRIGISSPLQQRANHLELHCSFRDVAMAFDDRRNQNETTVAILCVTRDRYSRGRVRCT